MEKEQRGREREIGRAEREGTDGRNIGKELWTDTSRHIPGNMHKHMTPKQDTTNTQKQHSGKHHGTQPVADQLIP